MQEDKTALKKDKDEMLIAIVLKKPLACKIRFVFFFWILLQLTEAPTEPLLKPY